MSRHAKLVFLLTHFAMARCRRSNYCHYNRSDLPLRSLSRTTSLATAIKIAGRHRFARVLSRRQQCISNGKWAEKRRKAARREMPRRKARGISEIYTGHKRREGVVKVFRCTLLARVRASDTLRNSLPFPFRHHVWGWNSSVLRVPGDSMGARSVFPYPSSRFYAP